VTGPARVTCGAALLGFSCTAALPARSLGQWNVVRLSQPVCYLLAMPLVSALGHVAFPRLASAGGPTAKSALPRRRSILASGGIGIGGMSVLALTAPWLVPIAFGPDFSASITLIWLLVPAGVFLPATKVCADLLRGHGRPHSVARVQAASAPVMAASPAGLVPLLAQRGAAADTSATALVSYLPMRRTLRRAVDDTSRRSEP
jgi:O-antigen/teichoic acid export membrane protein